MESNTAINNSHPAADGQPLLTMAETKIALGQRLLQTLSLFRPIDGAQKIERKIGQEVKFLERVMQTGQLKVNHVLCSNLVHYESLAQTLLQCASIKHIDYPVAVAERQSPLRVDIVCDNGRTWIKGERYGPMIYYGNLKKNCLLFWPIARSYRSQPEVAQ